jgi:hypothetical protein
MKHVQLFESFINESYNRSVNEAAYDVPDFGYLSVNGKTLKVEFYNLDDWDSSMYYGGGRGRRQALKDIKLAAKKDNDPLLDEIETRLDDSGLGEINWDKPIKVTDGGESLEFVLESKTSVNENLRNLVDEGKIPRHARDLSKKTLKKQWKPDIESDNPEDNYIIKLDDDRTLRLDTSIHTGQYTLTDKKGDIIYQGMDPYELSSEYL